eukprot:3214877-Rhodomonas_salina.1
MSVRIKFLRHLRRLKCKGEEPGGRPVQDETVHLTDRILLVVRWQEMMASVVERAGSPAIAGTQ